MFNFGNKKANTVGELFSSFSQELQRIRGEQFKIAEQKQQEIAKLSEEAAVAADEGNKADKLLEKLGEIL